MIIAERIKAKTEATAQTGTAKKKVAAAEKQILTSGSFLKGMRIIKLFHIQTRPDKIYTQR